MARSVTFIIWDWNVKAGAYIEQIKQSSLLRPIQAFNTHLSNLTNDHSMSITILTRTIHTTRTNTTSCNTRPRNKPKSTISPLSSRKSIRQPYMRLHICFLNIPHTTTQEKKISPAYSDKGQLRYIWKKKSFLGIQKSLISTEMFYLDEKRNVQIWQSTMSWGHKTN